MNEQFADSFVFLAMLNPQDRRHQAAVEALKAPARRLVTSGWVLTE
jgi:predicted nucleic acid-binding protein